MRQGFHILKQGLWSIVRALTPPPAWRPAAMILLGAATGLSVYLYHISNAAAYLSDDPLTCINCHVMIPQYTSWRHSSHARVATCVDCHVPHDNAFHKYQFKMQDGMRHATIFTLRQEPQVIRIKDAGRAVVQDNCIHCHETVLQDITAGHVSLQDAKAGEGKLCWDCHREVPHGRVRSLSAAPYALTPRLPGETPEWLRRFLPLIEHNALPNSIQQGEGHEPVQ